jgi:uncharacterized DUF497 family protein
MHRIALAALALTLAIPAAAHADASRTAFADAVHEVTTDHYRGWIIGKLTTWKVGAQCWEKIQDKEGRIVSLASFLTREIAEYAKQVTGDDWAAIEGSGTSEKAANKGKVEPMIDAFRSRFSLAVKIDGDDCDSGHDPLWMQYVMHAAQNVNKLPPASGKAFISIDVSSKAKKFAITVGKDRSTFKITAPKSIAAPEWQNRMESAFKKVAKKQ